MDIKIDFPTTNWNKSKSLCDEFWIKPLKDSRDELLGDLWGPLGPLFVSSGTLGHIDLLGYEMDKGITDLLDFEIDVKINFPYLKTSIYQVRENL